MAVNFCTLQQTFLGLVPFDYAIFKKNVAKMLEKIPVLNIRSYTKVSNGEFNHFSQDYVNFNTY